jgi:hypothetical protein
MDFGMAFLGANTVACVVPLVLWDDVYPSRLPVASLACNV